MILKDVVKAIEEEFDLPLAEDFDNVGLLCGNLDRNISGILIAHDALENVVEEALQNNINLIVCFHPIIFLGLKSLTGKDYVERSVIKAIENKIAIYAIHTAWDNDYLGVNYRICEELGLKEQKILMPKKDILKQMIVYVPTTYENILKEAIFNAGAGSIGFYDECSFSVNGNGTFRPKKGSNPFIGKELERESVSEISVSFVYRNHLQNSIVKAIKSVHPYEEIAYQIYTIDNDDPYTGLGRTGVFDNPMDEKDFLDFVKEKFDLKVIRHSKFLGKKIKKVGVLGGSGVSGIKAAISQQCDVYLTGDVKYHDFFKAEDKMMICDIGHFESERFVTQQLFDKLSEKFPKFAVLKSKENTNPVNYFL